MAAALHPQSPAKWLSLMKNMEKKNRKITEAHGRKGVCVILACGVLGELLLKIECVSWAG